MTTYAVSDLHGCKVFYEQIKKYIKSTDCVCCLGDAGDRGPQPWETLKLCLDDPQFIYIKGNHDEMLLDVMKYKLFQDNPWELSMSIQLLHYNGGMDTYYGWLEENEDIQREYYEKLFKTPFYMWYKNTSEQKIILSHAGGTPGIEWQWDEDELLWSRTHFEDEWPENLTDVYVVHGHTPVNFLRPGETENKFDVYIYADGHKIDIDTGAKWSNKACLFNLDTLEPIYFTI